MSQDEVKKLEEIIHKCNNNLSFLQNRDARMYKNTVESIRETGDCKKNPH